VGRIDESPSQMAPRLMRASNCCEESSRSWKEFGHVAKNIASITEAKFHEIIPRLAKNIKSMHAVARGVRIDEHVKAMKSDGSIKYLLENGISQDDINSERFMFDEIKFSKLASLLDEKDVPGAAKDFLCHTYLKLTLSRLAAEKTSYAFRLHDAIHRDYKAENNRAYPLLKMDGSIYKINTICSRSLKSGTNQHYSYALVKPFINSKLTGEQRAKLYDQLEVRRLASKDLAANESSLEGQYGVFAAQEISAGTCIGVHGGTFFSCENLAAELGITPEDVLDAASMEYMVCMSFGSKNRERLRLDANNIISKINTFFFQGREGWRQAKWIYNAESAVFKCEMDDGKNIGLHAIFATRDISPGQEIRMNYNYPPEVVTEIKHAEDFDAGDNKEDLVKSILSLTLHDPCETKGERME
jgi:hypothetical protein